MTNYSIVQKFVSDFTGLDMQREIYSSIELKIFNDALMTTFLADEEMLEGVTDEQLWRGCKDILRFNSDENGVWTFENKMSQVPKILKEEMLNEYKSKDYIVCESSFVNKFDKR